MTFAYFRLFLRLKCTAGPDWPRKFIKPMNINFAYKALQKLVIFRYGGFEVTVSDKWLHKMKEEEECKKTSSDQSTAVQEMACPHQQKLHTWCVAFGESVLQSLTRKNNLSRCKQNKGV